MSINIDWRSIRPLHGGREKAFEELCSQLAHSEVGGKTRFIRKGNPDAGVECFAINEDGTECAWQAKYFFALGNKQWVQIDRSVDAALRRHPRLKRYVVCLPMDLPDARVPGKTSALAKWDARVQRWKKQASELGMTVEFERWGSSELLERLAKPEHAGWAMFWFGAASFDDRWFATQLDVATSAAGPRYTPEVHVDLPIADQFEAFGRTKGFFDRTVLPIRRLAGDCRSAWSLVPSHLGNVGGREVEGWIEAVLEDTVMKAAKLSIAEKVAEIVSSASAIDAQPSGALPFHEVADKIALVKSEVEGVAQHLSASHAANPVVSAYRYQFETLAGGLREMRRELLEAQRWGEADVMVVQGQAGSGKTHLLCDITHRRLDKGHPTVLLQGQSFTSNQAPWVQATELLDLSGSSFTDVVGALECAAQAAGVRALVLIDGLNEGRGPSLWPTHLAALLAHFAKSDWIGVVLSIRSSYDKLIPKEVLDRAVVTTHQGFGERSYDAMQTYFVHYGLDLPSTPLIAPEFSNPLFLKTLCQGLRGQGATKLRQDIQGATKIFSLYLSSIQNRVATRLGLSPWGKTVEKALRVVVEAFPGSSERWLSVEHAEELVNALLPGRRYDESLYTALVAEGVLVQDAPGAGGRGNGSEIVFIAYDRLADHLVAEAILESHSDTASTVASLASASEFEEIAEGGHATQGVLEALCIQLPEQTGHEVADLVPRLAHAKDFDRAFSDSLVWRDPGTITERTCELVRKILPPTNQGFHTTLGSLLTLASIPGHPLNAQFLDSRLRQDSMAARDAWWSIFLHGATSEGEPARRLMDWALEVSPAAQLDPGLVDLCAMTLAWTQASSNPAVRDQATKALVNLLTGRLVATSRLVNRFSDVDDPYVFERVNAVAYGVATRCHDPGEMKILAECVYSNVFGDGAPPANILLRDYARGVVERALHLRALLDIDTTRIGPPYDSQPPVFPTADEVAPLLPSPDHDPYKPEGEDWSRSHVGHSVLEGDMHRAIRDTWGCSGEWLSLGLDQPAWREPDDSAGARTDRAIPPVFDRSLIERYVLQRVFEMGWIAERFGSFDRTSGLARPGLGQYGPSRDRSIGRKYQLIAYREVLALIADRFQFRGHRSNAEHEHRYVGPWQCHLRDIDPTRTDALPAGGRWSRQGSPGAWWTAGRYDSWEERDRLSEWAERYELLPSIEDLLMVRRPRDGTRWLNGGGTWSWRPEPPIGRNLFEVETGQIWWWIRAFLTSEQDAATLVDWAGARNFWDDLLQELGEVYDVFLGEHGWAPVTEYKQLSTGRLSDGTSSISDSPVRLSPVAQRYAFGMCAPVHWLHVPSQRLMQVGRLSWNGQAADFLGSDGNVACVDPSAHEAGPSALLVSEDFATELLQRLGLAMVWIVGWEKSVWSSGLAPVFPPIRASGAFRLSETGPVGVMRPWMS